MNKAEMEALKNGVRQDYDLRIKQLEDERDQKLAAIDLVAEMFEKGPTVQAPRASVPQETKPQVNVSQLVRDAINSLDGEFSIKNVRDYVGCVDPSIVISRNVSHSVFSEHLENEIIEVVKPGKGRMPTTYRKTKKQEEDQHELP